jgi:hypothetical protein
MGLFVTYPEHAIFKGIIPLKINLIELKKYPLRIFRPSKLAKSPFSLNLLIPISSKSQA